MSGLFLLFPDYFFNGTYIKQVDRFKFAVIKRAEIIKNAGELFCFLERIDLLKFQRDFI